MPLKLTAEKKEKAQAKLRQKAGKRCGQCLNPYETPRSSVNMVAALMDVVFCDAGTTGSVCDALSMMAASYMTTLKRTRQAPGSYQRAREGTEIQHLVRDTPQDASTPVDGTMSCKWIPTSGGRRPLAGSRSKNNAQ